MQGRANQCAAAGLAGLIEQFGEAHIESWSPVNWEAFTLQALWRVCQRQCASVPPPSVRHRDWLLAATGVDSDRPVHNLLIHFSVAFLDQGLGRW